MSSDVPREVIEVLDCEIDVRPKAAPGIPELLPLVLESCREDGSLIVRFDPVAAENLAAFVEAERLCCAGIGWDIERGQNLQLRITANTEQLSFLEKLWATRQANEI